MDAQMNKQLTPRRDLRRRTLLGSALGGLSLLLGCRPEASRPSAVSMPPAPVSGTGATAAPALVAEVWKSPYCGCCKLWVQHLEANGFTVATHDVPDTTAMRKQLGMPVEYGSCHSARIAGYAIEGHVPADDIKRLLTEKPDAIGLSVPGMPIGSPGMEQGSQRDKYDVLLVLRDGRTKVYQSHS